MMLSFIEEIGAENLIVMLILLFVIVLVTLIAIIADSRNRKEERLYKCDLEKKHRVDVFVQEVSPKKEEIKIDESTTIEELEEKKEPVILEEEKEEKLEIPEEPVIQEVALEEVNEKELEKRKAQEELRRLELELQNKEEKVGPTVFELEQERNAIINYEELKRASGLISERDEALLKDEGDEPISIDEVYEREHLRKQVMFDFDTPEREFKTSEVLSPVFGVAKNNNHTICADVREVEMQSHSTFEMEIAKTEQFLRELRELRSKLD